MYLTCQEIEYAQKKCWSITWRLWMHTLLADFLHPAGNPEKQKEADKKHRALATKSGGMNDFVTLLTVFQLCKSR